MIDPSVLRSAWKHRLFFQTANPFRNVVIDGFFKPEFAERLLSDFPKFEPANAMNEFGEPGRKAVVTQIEGISPFYRTLRDYLLSRDFSSGITRLTGIKDLVADPDFYGGGTHENLDGQELDPHVDFNYLESQRLHRRLNLLLYLNKEWEADWGGQIEFHSNPRRPAENKIKSFLPLFNTCVLFETNERSWHGFPRIVLPPGKKHISRKSLSIYLYTRDRPLQETVAPHGTFYVPRPIPGEIQLGHQLTDADVRELGQLMARRDRFIEYYQQNELTVNAELDFLRSKIRLPLTGYVLQPGKASQYWADGLIGPGFEVTLAPQQPVRQMVLRGDLPGHWPDRLDLSATIDGGLAGYFRAERGSFEWLIMLGDPAAKPFTLRVTSDRWVNPSRDGLGPDVRDLLLVLTELRCLH